MKTDPLVNIDAECYILGACLKSKANCSDVVTKLTAADFSLVPNKIIFSRVSSLQRAGVEVDRITLAEALTVNGELGHSEVTLSYLIDLDQNYPKLENVGSWVTILREKTNLRRLAALAQDVIRRTELGDNPGEIIASVERTIAGSLRTSQDSGPEKMSAIMARYSSNDLLDPSRARGVGLYTGYRVLDEETGGIFPSEKWLFGGAPGTGKSAVIKQIALFNVLRGVGVVIFSLEMSKRTLFNHIVCSLAEVALSRFRTGSLSQTERMRLIDAAGQLNELPLYIDETARLTPAQLRMRVRRLVEEFGIGLTELDYLQLMRADKPRNNENENLSEICAEIQELSKDYTPLVIASKLSRVHKRMGQKPDLDDFGGSGSIEHLANTAVLLYREELDKKKLSDPSVRGKAEFLLRKQREGALRNIPMTFIGWKLQYVDLPISGGHLDD